MNGMRHMKFGPGWEPGDGVFAYNAQHGNCADYHAGFIGLARSSGIPARFAIEAATPFEADNGGKSQRVEIPLLFRRTGCDRRERAGWFRRMIRP
jgi:transglutaminase-like putative cysteine protease